MGQNHSQLMRRISEMVLPHHVCSATVNRAPSSIIAEDSPPLAMMQPLMQRLKRESVCVLWSHGGPGMGAVQGAELLPLELGSKAWPRCR